MTNDLGERAAAIVEQISDLPPDEQRAAVNDACGDDVALRNAVERLLAERMAQMETLVQETNERPAARDERVGEGPGTMIGDYKILQEIGEGGFGVVYMAEQSRPVVRKVALKIIKLGMDTRQVIARFEAERQALAMMDHPNIAKVLDAGATESGRPYFVMELVRGVPITEYCDRNHLNTEERIRLMIDTCHAVQHAHHKGIIHRDIKPSNVLVTLHDTRPVPKVIDFGIAKATNQKLTDKTVFTEYHQFIGTPEYMSPEQAEMSGLDVDTRTDIYSLGVLLYQLLTGTTPFSQLRSAAHHEVQRIIREEEPVRPSTRVSTLGDALVTTARHRGVPPASLGRVLRGDLDWIVMKTLEKDRNRRYETVNGLAKDLTRYLDGEPVLAGAPTTLYRVRRVAYRYRAAISTALVIMSAFVIAVAALVWGLLQVRNERDYTAELKVTSQAEILLRTMNSVRSYTSSHVRPHLLPLLDDEPEFIREVVPGFSAREVFDEFRTDEAYAQFLYKEATLNPTNPRDQADEFESALVEAFRADDETTELSGVRDATSGGKLFYLARPIRVSSPSCLECHGVVEDAPPSMLTMYGSIAGFGWEMDEIVGAQMVYVPASHLVDDGKRPFPMPILIVTAVTGLILGTALVWLFKRPRAKRR